MEDLKLLKKPAIIICFIVIFVVIYLYVTDVIEYKDHNKGFIESFMNEPRQSLDVVFIGSSHVFYGIYPMELWNDYGIASANLASSSQSYGLSYYAIEEAIKRQKPKLICMDLYYCFSPDKIRSNEYAHVLLDYFNPIDITKIKAVKELIEPKYRNEFYFDIIKYHSRWKNLTYQDFNYEEFYYKGGYPRGNIHPFTVPVKVDEGQTAELPYYANKYLMRIIKLCKDKNTKLVFMVMPHMMSAQHQMYYNKIKEIATKNQVPFINMMDQLQVIGFDFSRDLFSAGHTNISGGTKISKYLGKYIADNYHIQNHKKNKYYKNWNQVYRNYQLSIIQPWANYNAKKAFLDAKDAKKTSVEGIQ